MVEVGGNVPVTPPAAAGYARRGAVGIPTATLEMARSRACAAVCHLACRCNQRAKNEKEGEHAVVCRAGGGHDHRGPSSRAPVASPAVATNSTHRSDSDRIRPESPGTTSWLRQPSHTPTCILHLLLHHPPKLSCINESHRPYDEACHRGQEDSDGEEESESNDASAGRQGMLAVCRRWQRVARAAIPAVGAEAIRILGSETAVVVAFMVVHVVVAGVIADLSHCAAQLKKEQRTLALAFRHPPLHHASKKVSSFPSAQIPAVIVLNRSSLTKSQNHNTLA